MLDWNSNTISQEICIDWKPFHGGWISELIFKPKYSPGIVFILWWEEFALDPNIIQATSKHTARFNTAIFRNLAWKKISFEIIEHRHSAIVQTLWFNAWLIVEIPSCDIHKELSGSPVEYSSASLGRSLAKLGRSSAKIGRKLLNRILLNRHLLPYSWWGIYKPYSILKEYRTTEPIHTWELLSRNILTQNTENTTIDGVEIKWSNSGESLNLKDLLTGAEIIIWESNGLETTVLSAKHPDVRQLPYIKSQPYHTDYKHNNPKLLWARALGRVWKPLQWLWAKLLQSTWWYGISPEWYFMAYHSLSPEQLIQDMQDIFQEWANEHLAHTAEADFPSELRIPIQILNANGWSFGWYNSHFKLNNTNHITRVKILRALAEYVYN
jgi:hypothetical protein